MQYLFRFRTLPLLFEFYSNIYSTILIQLNSGSLRQTEKLKLSLDDKPTTGETTTFNTEPVGDIPSKRVWTSSSNLFLDKNKSNENTKIQFTEGPNIFIDLSKVEKRPNYKTLTNFGPNFPPAFAPVPFSTESRPTLLVRDNYQEKENTIPRSDFKIKEISTDNVFPKLQQYSKDVNLRETNTNTSSIEPVQEKQMSKSYQAVGILNAVNNHIKNGTVSFEKVNRNLTIDKDDILLLKGDKLLTGKFDENSDINPVISPLTLTLNNQTIFNKNNNLSIKQKTEGPRSEALQDEGLQEMIHEYENSKLKSSENSFLYEKLRNEEKINQHQNSSVTVNQHQLKTSQKNNNTDDQHFGSKKFQDIQQQHDINNLLYLTSIDQLTLREKPEYHEVKNLKETENRKDNFTSIKDQLDALTKSMSASDLLEYLALKILSNEMLETNNLSLIDAPSANNETLDQSHTSASNETLDQSPSSRNKTLDQSPSSYNKTLDQSPSSSNETPEQSPSSNNETLDQSTSSKNHTIDQPPTSSNETLDQSPSSSDETLDQSSSASNETLDQSPYSKNYTIDQPPTSSNETLDQSSSASNETLDQSPYSKNYTIDQSSPFSNETPDQSPSSNNETLYQSPYSNNETLDKSPPSSNETLDQSPYSNNEILDLSPSSPRNETLDQSLFSSINDSENGSDFEQLRLDLSQPYSSNKKENLNIFSSVLNSDEETQEYLETTTQQFLLPNSNHDISLEEKINEQPNQNPSSVTARTISTTSTTSTSTAASTTTETSPSVLLNLITNQVCSFLITSFQSLIF